MKYRIVYNEYLNRYQVESKKWWWPFWVFETKLIGFDSICRLEFTTKDEAINWIKNDKKYREKAHVWEIVD